MAKVLRAGLLDGTSKPAVWVGYDGWLSSWMSLLVVFEVLNSFIAVQCQINIEFEFDLISLLLVL